ncbi:PREDICTED: uncharacterized protein LOC104586161 isoform X1 [Nelumbo nucifera]|uniref:Uncharacterized protein LOC104586161 isoform X1 n=1 Tax=Nelumbo nucifera TaxID=4432 RepID=A0A1U7YRJ7_NELNU|nr:PREDICTED: uncharacterized protein LOC104586161 isoform X1 [Nelumbo nucifera]XP_010241618.1 PREDICTED: uncharacterized protein LOC104586161 isoform X1 [Nelumbo nucifera]
MVAMDMAREKLILICQSGGEFVSNNDGSLQYSGGEAHAVDVNRGTRFDDLKSEIAELWNCDIKKMSIKYFLPSNKHTLITVSNDKDLQRLIDFYGNSVTADVYIVTRESVSQDVLDMNGSRTNQTVVAESANRISSTPAINFPATPAAASPVVNASPSFTASLAAAAAAAAATLVDDDNTNGTPTSIATPANSTSVIPVGTTDSFTIAADITAPCSPKMVTTSSSPVPAASADDAIFESVGQQKRTASWKFGVNGFSIVSVTDGVGQKICTVSQDTTSNGEDDAGVKKLITLWKNGITGVGQQFSGVHEFRDALRKYSIAHHFMYILKKNEASRATAKCRADGCTWRIHASWVPTTQTFTIKRMNKTHTCGGNIGKCSPSTKNWLASIIRDRLQDSPHYKPKDIADEICRDFGIELNYSQVWRGVENARAQLQGSYKDAYNQLPWFCEKIVETNPGSICNFTTKDDLSFQHLFLSFHASLFGFKNGCRPILFLDSTPLKSKYQEILLIAAAVDGEDSMFPVAFAIVDVENDASWHWFLVQLKSAVSTSRSITFVSDKEKGLKKSVSEIFENAHHGYSIRHLVDNFKKSLKGPYHGDGKSSLVGNLLGAAHSPRLDGFRKCIQRIKNVSSEAYDWVMQSDPECWANSLFKGEQYSQINLKIAETFNNWIVEVRELPIIQKIDAIRCKMMELIYERRVGASDWSTLLIPSKEERLKEEISKIDNFKVLFSSDTMFEVHDNSINVVNIDQWDCSCQGWRMTGLPCRHAIAVFNCIGRNLYDYCSRYFMTESFQLTYSESINPMPNIGKPASKDSSDKDQVHPPRTQRQPKPPPTQPKRKRSRSKGKVQRPLHCSKCKGEGHNRASCKEAS